MKMTYLWMMQLATGFAILVLSLVHMASIHLRFILRFFGSEDAGAAPGQAAGGSWDVFLIFLSAVVLAHALFGLRQTVSELTPAARRMRLVSWALAAGGFILFISAT